MWLRCSFFLRFDNTCWRKICAIHFSLTSHLTTVRLVSISDPNALSKKITMQTKRKMIKYIRIAIILIIVLCFIVVDGFEEKKRCSRDFDCASYEHCSNGKCKNACVKHPCAENAICKVRPINSIVFELCFLCYFEVIPAFVSLFVWNLKAKFHVPLCSCAKGFVGNPFLECVSMDVMRLLAKPKQNRTFRHK